MRQDIGALLDFMAQDVRAAHCWELAQQTVFSSLCEEFGFKSVGDFMRKMDASLRKQVLPCALEFFFANDYPVGPRGQVFNIIDAFLDSPASGTLPEEERWYLPALRRSYMSVYEIVSVVPETSLTVRNTVEPGGPITVSEKAATRFLAPGDHIGGRLCLSPDGAAHLAGGVLKLPEGCVDELVGTIHIMHKATLAMAHMDAAQRDRMSKTDAERLCRGLWSTLVIEAYVRDVFEQHAVFDEIQQSLHTLLNRAPGQRKKAANYDASPTPGKTKKPSSKKGTSAKSGTTPKGPSAEHPSSPKGATRITSRRVH